jgi:hypothetical protein
MAPRLAAVLAFALGMLANHSLEPYLEVRAKAAITLIVMGTVYYFGRRWLAELLGED